MMQRGVASWAVLVFVLLICVVATYGLLNGAGVFKNWGKRGEERTADRVMSIALEALDQGDFKDRSAEFPPTDAGQVSRALYNFIRADLMEQPKIQQVAAKVPEVNPKTLAEAQALDKQANAAMQQLLKIKEARDDRWGETMLTLRAHSKGSDRLGNLYRRMAGNSSSLTNTGGLYDKPDNEYGGRTRLLSLRIDRCNLLTQRYELFIRLLKAKPDDPHNKETKTLIAEIDRSLNDNDIELKHTQLVMETAVAAERRRLARRLGPID
jgi:hypothetical protein